MARPPRSSWADEEAAVSDDDFRREVLPSPGGRLHDGVPPGVPAEEAARAQLQRRLETVTRVVLRPLASPLPLGFLALAAATLLTSALQLGWLAPDQQRPVALALITFVFPLQLLASILGHLCRDSVAGTGMGVLAGTWLTAGLVQLTSPAGSTSDGLGLFLLVAGAAMLVPAAGAALGKLVPAMVLLTTSLRFFTSGIYQLTSDPGWKLAAGWVGIFLFAVAVYAALAAELEDVRGKPALPTGRRAKGKMSIEGTLLDQVMDVHHEPGVRRQL
jgi:uncharacterized protein